MTCQSRYSLQSAGFYLDGVNPQPVSFRIPEGRSLTLFNSTYCTEGTELLSVAFTHDLDLSSQFSEILGSVLSFKVSTTRDIVTNGQWEKVVTAYNEPVADIQTSIFELED